jgi:hypothetical protein
MLQSLSQTVVFCGWWSKHLAGKFPNDGRQWQTMVEARDERQKNIATAWNWTVVIQFNFFYFIKIINSLFILFSLFYTINQMLKKLHFPFFTLIFLSTFLRVWNSYKHILYMLCLPATYDIWIYLSESMCTYGVLASTIL